MKYRAKRDFLGVTKGMEFPVDPYGNININILYIATSNGGMSSGQIRINPAQYPDDFEPVAEPKYTDSDLDNLLKKAFHLFVTNNTSASRCLEVAIAELKQSKEKK